MATARTQARCSIFATSTSGGRRLVGQSGPGLGLDAAGRLEPLHPLELPHGIDRRRAVVRAAHPPRSTLAARLVLETQAALQLDHSLTLVAWPEHGLLTVPIRFRRLQRRHALSFPRNS